MSQDEINIIKDRLMAQAEPRTINGRTRTVIPVGDMKATQIMVVFDVQSKFTAHSIARCGYYIVNYTKPAMCPGWIDMEEAYRIANWWLHKKLGGRLPHWAEPDDMIQDTFTRLIERGGRPPWIKVGHLGSILSGDRDDVPDDRGKGSLPHGTGGIDHNRGPAGPLLYQETRQ
jgi:hypothetical protein